MQTVGNALETAQSYEARGREVRRLVHSPGDFLESPSGSSHGALDLEQDSETWKRKEGLSEKEAHEEAA